MVLATHAIVGGALAVVAKADPVLAFSIGFLSHFLLDSIPHWDYPIRSSTKRVAADPMEGDFVIGRNFYFDLLSVGFDAFVGLLVVTIFFIPLLSIQEFLYTASLWGAIGAMFPDFLQFIYYKLRLEPFKSLQRFHLFIHAKTRMDKKHIVGPTLQILIVVLVIWLSIPFK
jgi:hypothetical protein